MPLPSPLPLTLTHAAACVVSIPLQRSSISTQESAYLLSLKLLRIVVAVTAVIVAVDALARCCVRRFNALAAQQHLKAKVLKQCGSDLPYLELFRIIVAVAAVAAVTFAGEAFLRLFSGTFATDALAAQQHVKAGGL